MIPGLIVLTRAALAPTHCLGHDPQGVAAFWGGPFRKISPGDVVWIPPGEKHWHGAAPDASMTHIAIQEALDGKVVDWMEKVSDQEYGKAGPS